MHITWGRILLQVIIDPLDIPYSFRRILRKLGIFPSIILTALRACYPHMNPPQNSSEGCKAVAHLLTLFDVCFKQWLIAECKF